MREWLINTSSMHALLWLIPAAAAWLLRRLRVGTGAAVLGGILAGLLLGPTIFGRAMPSYYQQMFIGGGEALGSVRAVEARQQADIIAARHAGLDERGFDELRQRHADELAIELGVLSRERHRHQRPLRTYTYVFIALLLVSAGAAAVREKVDPAHRQSIARTAASVGWWSAIIPGGSIFAFSFWWMELPLDSSLMIGAACAIGPWTLTEVDRIAAERAEIGGGAMMQRAGRIACVLAVLGAGAALWLGAEVANLGLIVTLLFLPIGWLWPWSEKAARRWKAWAENSFIPTLAACIAVKIDASFDWSVAAIIVIVLLSGDGRWTGAFVGAMLPGGRRAMRTMRLVLGAMAAGPTQLALTALGLHAGLVSPPMASALLLGAVMCDVTVKARRTMADRLESAEVEMKQGDP